MKTATILTRSLLFPLLAAGCYDIDDLSAVSKSDPDAAPDDGGQVVADAGWSAMLMLDAQVPATCASVNDCAEGELCAPNSICIARCDEGGACVVASTKHEVNSLVARGSSVYVALAPTRDRFSNANPDAELRAIVGDAPWSLVATRSTDRLSSLEVRADHLYWQENQRLFRVPRAGGAVEPVHPELVTTGGFVLSEERLAVRTNDGLIVAPVDGSGTATKLLAASECPLDPAMGIGCPLFRLTDNALYFQRYQGDATYLSSIDLGTLEQKKHSKLSGTGGFGDVAGSYFYGMAPSYTSMLYRRDLGESYVEGNTQDFILYRDDSDYFFQGERPVQLHGDWLYALSTTPWGFAGGEDRKFVRVAATGPVNVQDLLPKNFAPRGTFQPVEYAVGDAHVFVAVRVFRKDGVDGTLIYRIPLPASH